jgi:hypothetical protein
MVNDISTQIPPELVAAYRNQISVAVTVWGIDCTLYIKDNSVETGLKDAYASPDDDTFLTAVETRVSIEWSPNIFKLKQLGIFNEKDIPSLGYFLTEYELTIGSYIRTPITYSSCGISTDEFVISDLIMRAFHDEECLTVTKLTPRRLYNK